MDSEDGPPRAVRTLATSTPDLSGNCPRRDRTHSWLTLSECGFNMSDETAQSLRCSSCSESPSEDAMKILVVDDEEAVRELVKAAMMEQGYQVWIAASGRHGLDLGAEFEFDLVFCDVVMDGM